MQQAERLRAELTLCRQASEALHQECQLNAAILDTISTLVVVFDLEGHIIRFNEAFEQLTGYCLDEVKNQLFWDLFLTPDDLEPVKAVFRQLQLDQLPISDENDWLTKDGSRRRIAWSHTPFLDTSGALKYVINTGSDVSERRRAEQEPERCLQERTAELLQVEQLQTEIAQLRQENQRLRVASARYRECFENKVAQEQIAELAKANDALRQTLDLLATESDLNNFLGHVLKVIAQQLDAPLTEYWFHPEPGNIAYLGLSCLRGKILTPEEQPGHPGVVGFPVTPEMIHNENLHQRQRHFVIEDVPTYAPIVENDAQIGFDTERWCAERGVRKQLNVPLRLGEKSVGGLITWIPSDRSFTNQQIELAYALAQLVTLAIQITQLAEQAKLAAIAREQEKAAQERAAELAQANDALKRTISKLAQEPQLDAFLCNVMTAAAEQVGACSSALFVYDENTHTLSMQAFVDDGQPVDIATDPRMEIWRVPVPADITPAWELFFRKGGHVIHEMDESDPIAWPQSIGWHRMMGNVSVLCLPLVVGGRSVGFIGFDFKHQADVVEEKVELARALTHQATLALELTRLADQARQSAVSAAIAREQELAATERAVQLAKANNALKRNLDSLATQPELEAFLQSVVNEAAAQTKAASAHLFLYDEHTDSLSLSVATDNGGDWRSVADMELWKRPFPANSTPAWETITSSRTPFVVELSQANPLLWAGTWAWHQQRGQTRAVIATLWLGEKPLGFLGLAFTAGETFTPEELELVQALAQQATLAIELTSLAEQAKQEAQQAAIVEERNRMAREIHDTLAQAFTGLSIHLGITKRFVLSQPESAITLIEQAIKLAHAGLAEARRSVWELLPQADDYRDLVQSLGLSLDLMTASTSIQTQMLIQGNPRLLPSVVGLNLLRIGQEALTNALKYAQAQQIVISIQFTPEAVRLCVQDDGRGFDPSHHTSSGGFGLLGMRQRCDRIGAQLTIRSQPGQGTAIVAFVPLV